MPSFAALAPNLSTITTIEVEAEADWLLIGGGCILANQLWRHSNGKSTYIALSSFALATSLRPATLQIAQLTLHVLQLPAQSLILR
jgi:hypothetical protein